jgi:hypothetical protein
MTSEPLVVLSRIATILDGLRIPYVVGGSMASSTYGTPRATLDVDVIADIPVASVSALTHALQQEFDVDPAMIREAVRERGSFNALYLATMFKADIFVARDDAWSREEMSRGTAERVETSEGLITVRFASPEDTLLHKLVWYKLGNQVSDRQGDVIGMMKIQHGVLDQEYLDHWAVSLEVNDLLARARKRAAE